MTVRGFFLETLQYFSFRDFVTLSNTLNQFCHDSLRHVYHDSWHHGYHEYHDQKQHKISHGYHDKDIMDIMTTEVVNIMTSHGYHDTISHGYDDLLGKRSWTTTTSLTIFKLLGPVRSSHGQRYHWSKSECSSRNVECADQTSQVLSPHLNFNPSRMVSNTTTCASFGKWFQWTQFKIVSSCGISYI